MDNIERVILRLADEQWDKNRQGADFQRLLLECTAAVLPPLEIVKSTTVGQELYHTETTEVTRQLMGGLIFSVEKILSSVVMENIKTNWEQLELPVLLKGLHALHYYDYISKDCSHISRAYGTVVQYIKTRVDPAVLETRVAAMVDGAVAEIRNAENCYVVYHRTLGEHVPMITADGCATLCASRERADAVVEGNKEIPLAVKTIPQAEIDGYLRTWHAFGIEKILLKPNSDAPDVNLTVSDYLKEKTPDYQGTQLNFLLLRARQTEGIETMKGLHSLLWAAACEEMKKTLYLVPVCYEGEQGAPVEDKFVHCTARSAERRIQMQLEKQLGTSLLDYMAKTEQKEGEEHPLVGMTVGPIDADEVPFHGCENYSFAQAQTGEAVQYGKNMHVQTAVMNGKSYLPLFTDMKALHALFGEQVRVAMFTWEDIVDRLHDVVEKLDNSTSEIEGIAVNPGLKSSFLLPVQMVQAICEKTLNKAENTQKTQEERIEELYKGVKAVPQDARFCKASIWLGILSLFMDLSPTMGLLAIIFGILGRKNAKKEERPGAGKALAGIILGSVGFLKGLVMIYSLITTLLM